MHPGILTMHITYLPIISWDACLNCWRSLAALRCLSCTGKWTKTSPTSFSGCSGGCIAETSLALMNAQQCSKWWREIAPGRSQMPLLLPPFPPLGLAGTYLHPLSSQCLLCSLTALDCVKSDIANCGISCHLPELDLIYPVLQWEDKPSKNH